MNDVDIVPVDDLAKIRVALDVLSDFAQCRLQMLFVNVTYRQEFGPAIPEMSLSHAAYTDDSLGQLIARCNLGRAAQDFSRYDRENRSGACNASGAPEKLSSCNLFSCHLNSNS